MTEIKETLKPSKVNYPTLIVGAIIFFFMFWVAKSVLRDHLNWFTLTWFLLSIFIFYKFLTILFEREILTITDTYIKFKKGPFGAGLPKTFKKEDILKIGLTYESFLELEQKAADRKGVTNWRLKVELKKKTVFLGKYLSKEKGYRIMDELKKLKYTT
jgi:energy-coupling factor transporter transmembrane protein EcfT